MQEPSYLQPMRHLRLKSGFLNPLLEGFQKPLLLLRPEDIWTAQTQVQRLFSIEVTLEMTVQFEITIHFSGSLRSSSIQSVQRFKLCF